MKIGYLMEAGVPDVRQARPSGPANHVRETIAELRRLGHDVRLVARLDGRIWRSDDLEEYREVRVRLTDDGPRRLVERALRRVQWTFRLPYLSWFDGRRFAGACVQELKGFDLLYERMGWMGLGGGLAARRLGIPHVLEVNGDLLPELRLNGAYPGAVQRAVSVRLMRRMLQAADHAVATGEGWRSEHVRRWGVRPDRVSVVQNGSRLVDLLGREGLRAFRTHVPPSEPLRVAFAGSFDRWQGLDVLLEATAKAVASGGRLRLSLAGTGRLEADLRRQSAALGLSEVVEFVGHLSLSSLAQCLARSDVGVCLYRGRAEYTGLKLLDYKAAGLATIAAAEGGQPALIEHGRTGLIVPPGDAPAVCGALLRLAADTDWARRMGRAAREDAERRHRWSHTAAALDQLFRLLLDDSAPPEGRNVVGPLLEARSRGSR